MGSASPATTAIDTRRLFGPAIRWNRRQLAETQVRFDLGLQPILALGSSCGPDTQVEGQLAALAGAAQQPHYPRPGLAFGGRRGDHPIGGDLDPGAPRADLQLVGRAVRRPRHLVGEEIPAAGVVEGSAESRRADHRVATRGLGEVALGADRVEHQPGRVVGPDGAALGQEGGELVGPRVRPGGAGAGALASDRQDPPPGAGQLAAEGADLGRVPQLQELSPDLSAVVGLELVDEALIETRPDLRRSRRRAAATARRGGPTRAAPSIAAARALATG